MYTSLFTYVSCVCEIQFDLYRNRPTAHLLQTLTSYFPENFMTRVVSASDLNRNKKVAGLQDNVELLVKYMMKGKPSLHSVVMFRWADIRHFLGVTIALAVSVLWNQVGKYS